MNCLRLAVVAVALCPSVSLGGPVTVEEQIAFANYVTNFNRNYATTQEFEQKFENFRNNMALVHETNSKNLSYKLGVNNFADVSRKEFASSHFGLVTPKKPFGNAAHMGTHKYSGASLARDVDWVAAGAVTYVKNQGQCGSCWSFSTTGALEGAWKIATGKLVAMSEQELVDCNTDSDSGCNGGLMDNAFEWFKQGKPVCTEDSYPYKAYQHHCDISSCTVAIPAYGVVGYKDVTADDTRAMMEAVAQQPVSIAIEADQDSFQMYESGVLTRECGDSLDHGVLCVGYGVDDSGLRYWKVKNSWGATWGEDGYIRLLRGRRTGRSGECGIKANPSYPVVQSDLVV